MTFALGAMAAIALSTAVTASEITPGSVEFTEKTVMPGFRCLEAGKDVAENYVGKSILTAQQVEDVLTYTGVLNEVSGHAIIWSRGARST